MPPISCERAVFGLRILPHGEHAEHARHADLAGVRVDAHLGELRAVARAATAARQRGDVVGRVGVRLGRQSGIRRAAAGTP